MYIQLFIVVLRSKRKRKRTTTKCNFSVFGNLLFFPLCFLLFSNAVSQVVSAPKQNTQRELSDIKSGYIKNIGQYGDSLADYESMGKIAFGYEGLSMPILFTATGIIYLQRKIIKREEHKEQDARKKSSKDIKEEESKYKAVDKIITMQWVGANPDPEIIAEEVSGVYHTYGLIQKKAAVYKKLIYKELYPGIDVVYSFVNNEKKGFEYSIIARPGTDLSKIKMKYGADISSIKKDKQGLIIIRSSIDGIIETVPVCFYSTGSTETSGSGKENGNKINVVTKISGNEISFSFPDGYDTNSAIIIDPFVTSLNDFTGLNSDKAYDIDYDYDGNIYVRGGGDYIACELAKYSPSGTLIWVFHGTLTVPSWNFGHFNGGWVVEKNTGRVFVGQGGELLTGGFRIIRLDANGLYDNYITIQNPDFAENWKMLWACNGGQPQIFAAGGGLSSNINLSICAPPSPNLSPLNITGIPVAFAQDIADALIDPETNDMYSIFASVNPAASFVNNRIYKHLPPYNSGTIAWSNPSGFTAISENGNRPYLVTNNAVSVNALAINPSYLFHWDGKNLKAFDKSTGNSAGTALTIAGNTALMQGGIAADACNNVFVGDINGLIKVYQFNGTTFDDAAAPDIVITGFPTNPTYALAYDNGKKLIYACGQGFVASFDVSSYCFSQIYTVNTTTNCQTNSVSASLTPLPPTGSTLTYNLYNGTTFISSNTTGVFNSLTPNINYTVRAVINLACSGVQFEKDFSLVAPVITAATTPATCTQNIGSITITGTLGTLPYTYSLDGINFQNSNTFNNLAIGTYTVTIKDANGCSNTALVTVPLSGTNTVTLTAGTNGTICEGTGITLGATSNANTFSWSPTTGLNNSTVLNPVASPLVTTKYYIIATSGPCTRTDSLIVFVDPAPIANAGTDQFICNGKDAQLNGSGGVAYTWSPSTYLDNVNITNPNVIQPLNTITYSLNVTGNNGCKSINTASVIITVRPPENVFAGNDTSIAINQPLQLNAIDVNNTGFTSYFWSPSYGLNDVTLKSPAAILDRDITYTVTARTAEDCKGTSTINIKVFKGPAIYVPTAFTPNGDGHNDIFKAIPIGLKEFKYLVVFNRYGEQVFYTKDAGKGWDGKVKGKSQNTGNYVWVVEGMDYKGNLIKKSGGVILVR